MNKLQDSNFDYKCNIITLGDSTVGKTSLLFQFMGQKNPLKQVATVGIDYFTKDVNIDGKIVRTKIWDTAGQERYRSITDNFFKNSNGVLLVYDISIRETFDNLKVWVQSINLKVPEKEVKKILIGNKVDLEREVEYEEAKEFANSQGLEYFETSAKENLNIKESIEHLISKILESGTLPPQNEPEPKRINSNSIQSGMKKKDKEKRKCCN